jgi:hypothetical protein
MYTQTPDIDISNLLSVNALDEFLKEKQRERCTRQIAALKEVIAFCKEHETIQQDAIWEMNREKTVRWCIEFRMPTEYRLP